MAIEDGIAAVEQVGAKGKLAIQWQEQMLANLPEISNPNASTVDASNKTDPSIDSSDRQAFEQYLQEIGHDMGGFNPNVVDDLQLKKAQDLDSNLMSKFLGEQDQALQNLSHQLEQLGHHDKPLGINDLVDFIDKTGKVVTGSSMLATMTTSTKKGFEEMIRSQQ